MSESNEIRLGLSKNKVLGYDECVMEFEKKEITKKSQDFSRWYTDVMSVKTICF